VGPQGAGARGSGDRRSRQTIPSRAAEDAALGGQSHTAEDADTGELSELRFEEGDIPQAVV
jgi:hypothetical protein